MTEKIMSKEGAAEGGKKTKSQTKTLVACLALALSVLFHQGWFAKTITTQDPHQTSTEVVITPDPVWWVDWSDWWWQNPTWSLRWLPWESRVEPVEETPWEREQREWKEFRERLKYY